MSSSLLRRSALLAGGLAVAVTPLLASSQVSAAPAAGGPTGKSVSASGWCHYAKPWGGTFYCKSDVKIKLPNGYWQAFVIGTNKGAYTQWSSRSGLSGWKHLDNGYCTKPGHHSMDVWDTRGWSFNVTCIGLNGKRYYDHRYANGHWSGWITKRIR
ncbi:hypothetical protein ABZT08_08150 [Streptomyces sp. NPDC005526]|uniref:hypothetical protein n=1 Tax=unclassified Streptomyces TaxID=2593676 RepID=UPI0033A96B3D